MPEQENMFEKGLIPMGCTPHLLFTFGCPAEVDENNIPLGPTMIVHHPDLYLLVRDILMEQQALIGAQDAADRCDVNDLSPPLRDHLPQGGSAAVEDAGQIRPQYSIPVLIGHQHQEVIPHHSHVVDQDVDPAITVRDILHHGAGLLVIGYIRLVRNELAPQGFGLLG